jgi:hypothetical protein
MQTTGDPPELAHMGIGWTGRQMVRGCDLISPQAGARCSGVDPLQEDNDWQVLIEF